MTLYEDLGVPKDADRATIKRAYRKKAQKLHPDRPDGDGEKFHAITRAYDILYDDARRAHYDATGQDGKTDREGDLHRRLAALFMQVIEQHDIDRTDIVTLMRQNIGNGRQMVQQSIQGAEQKIAKYERVKKRLKKKGGGDNLFIQMVDGQIGLSRRGIEMAKNEMAMMDDMMKMLADYQYSVESGQRMGSVYFGAPIGAMFGGTTA